MTTALRNGRYTLDERIAVGGMGEVWRGTDTSLGRRVAVKLLRTDLAEDDSFRTRFAGEARHAASLHDPHIATIFDYGDEQDATGRHSTYLVMELVDGRPLSWLINGPIAPDRAALLVAQAAEGLAVAHAAGIVHRDVKPANLLVTPDGRVKITDFGIARARGAASITDAGTIMGSPHYLAPEVAEGREATPASDLYSLGVVLYEAASGVKPFAGETPVAIALAHLHDDPRPLPDFVPARLRAIVGSAMAKDPQDRPADAAAVATALRRFANDPDAQTTTAFNAPASTTTQVLPALPTTRPDDDSPGARSRRRLWIPVAAAAVVALLVAGIAYAVSTRDADDQADQPNEPAAQQPAPTTSPTTTSSPTPTTPSTTPVEDVTVDPADYVGRNVKDVEKQLEALDLVVAREDVEGGEKDIVAGLAPTGTVQVGQLVTLSVYQGDKDETPGHKPGDDDHPDKPGHSPGKPDEHEED